MASAGADGLQQWCILLQQWKPEYGFGLLPGQEGGNKESTKDWPSAVSIEFDNLVIQGQSGAQKLADKNCSLDLRREYVSLAMKWYKRPTRETYFARNRLAGSKPWFLCPGRTLYEYQLARLGGNWCRPRKQDSLTVAELGLEWGRISGLEKGG